jgi:hypothetical protein
MLQSTELVWDILQESYRILNNRFHLGFDSDTLGLYAEMENPTIMRVRNKAVWQDNGMNFVFIGKTQNEQHIRV